MCFETECVMAVQGHPRSFGTNGKRVCDLVLVINSNLGPILPRFRDIAGFLLRRATPPLFHPNFRGVPLDYVADVVAPRSEDHTLIIRVIKFELVHGTTTLQTDRRTDGRTTYDSSNTYALVLRASRCNKTLTHFSYNILQMF